MARIRRRILHAKTNTKERQINVQLTFKQFCHYLSLLKEGGEELLRKTVRQEELLARGTTTAEPQPSPEAREQNTDPSVTKTSLALRSAPRADRQAGRKLSTEATSRTGTKQAKQGSPEKTRDNAVDLGGNNQHDRHVTAGLKATKSSRHKTKESSQRKEVHTSASDVINKENPLPYDSGVAPERQASTWRKQRSTPRRNLPASRQRTAWQPQSPTLPLIQPVTKRQSLVPNRTPPLRVPQLPVSWYHYVVEEMTFQASVEEARERQSSARRHRTSSLEPKQPPRRGSVTSGPDMRHRNSLPSEDRGYFVSPARRASHFSEDDLALPVVHNPYAVVRRRRGSWGGVGLRSNSAHASSSTSSKADAGERVASQRRDGAGKVRLVYHAEPPIPLRLYINQKETVDEKYVEGITDEHGVPLLPLSRRHILTGLVYNKGSRSIAPPKPVDMRVTPRQASTWDPLVGPSKNL